MQPRALEAEKARLQQQREWEAALAHAEATAAAMEQTERKIHRKKRTGGS